MLSSHLYFAYADNMSEDIVRKICPGVSFEGIAELKKHRFTFNSQGKATIVEDINNYVWGVIWCLSSRDIHLLDKKEKLNLGNFEKINKTVMFKTGRQDEAFVYITANDDDPVPSQSILNFVIDQALYWALPDNYISFLKNLRNDHLKLKTQQN